MDCAANCVVRRLYRRVIPVAKFDPANPNTSADVTIWVTNPSVMLSCFMALVLQPDNGQTIVFGTGAEWQVTPAIPPDGANGTVTQRQALQPVFLDGSGTATPRPLPDGYAVADPTKLIKIDATLEADGAANSGVAYAVVTWEGIDPDLTQKELDNLFGACDVSIDGGARALAAV